MRNDERVFKMDKYHSKLCTITAFFSHHYYEQVVGNSVSDAMSGL